MYHSMTQNLTVSTINTDQKTHRKYRLVCAKEHSILSLCSAPPGSSKVTDDCIASEKLCGFEFQLTFNLALRPQDVYSTFLTLVSSPVK